MSKYYANRRRKLASAKKTKDVVPSRAGKPKQLSLNKKQFLPREKRRFLIAAYKKRRLEKSKTPEAVAERRKRAFANKKPVNAIKKSVRRINLKTTSKKGGVPRLSKKVQSAGTKLTMKPIKRISISKVGKGLKSFFKGNQKKFENEKKNISSISKQREKAGNGSGSSYNAVRFIKWYKKRKKKASISTK